MGVEDGKTHREPQEQTIEQSLRDSAVTELDARQESVTVFDRMAELQRQLEEAQAQLEQRRAVDRARAQRWRANNPEEARRQSRESMRATRARRKQSGS